MTNLEIRGATPQKSKTTAGEVVLTREESDFFSLLLLDLQDDPFTSPDKSEMESAARRAGLLPKHVEFIRAWILHKGDMVAMSEESLIEPDKFSRYLGTPSVFRLLTRAAEVIPNLPPPIPTKEELATMWGVIARTPSFPVVYQREARQELAKLQGYYAAGDSVNVGVQVVLKGDLTDD